MPGMEGIDMPGIAKVPVTHFKFSVSTSVPEIDAAITRKENDLKVKEEELRVFQRAAEKELLEYESHKSEILLGRIYVALKELAVKEEVSVIVDKRNILFGQNAVDLTDKLLKKLEEGGL
jgi:Skp family chaperone for outer membrane proteins